MSITVTTTVVCDFCSAWVHGTHGSRPDRKMARYSARRKGWARRDGQDMCPSCAVERDLRRRA